MDDIAQAYASLELAKPASFGSVLREAIKSEFGSNSEFAKCLGISKGRVSQIICGPETIGAESLGKILSALESETWRREVLSAWTHDFVVVEERRVEPFEFEIALQRAEQLTGRFLPRQVIELVHTQRQFHHNLREWAQLTVQLIYAAQRLCEMALAAENVLEMMRRAEAANDNEVLFTALWLKAIVLQSLPNSAPEEIWSILRQTYSLVERERSRSRAARQNWNPRLAALERDTALFFIKQVDQKRLSKSNLDKVQQRIPESIRLGNDPGFQYYGLEVLARYWLAMEEPSRTEDVLDELAALPLRHGSDLKEKMALSRARLLEFEGKTDEAILLYQTMSQEALCRSNIHHNRLIQNCLSKLILGRGAD